MTVIIDGAKAYKGKQQIFITLTVDGDTCKFQPKVPAGLSGQDLQNYVDANENKYKLIILKHKYPESAGTPRNIYYGNFEDFEKWIKDGRIAPAVLDSDGNEVTPESVIAKVPFEQKHPKVIIDRAAFDLLDIAGQIDILADLLLDD